MRRYGWLAIIVFALVIDAAAAAGQELRGVVVAMSSRAPLPGALVTLVDSAGRIVAAVRAGDAAEFTLRAPAEGYYSVHTRRVGFAPRRSAPLLLEPLVSFRMEVELDELPQALPAVTVSAERDYVMRRLRPGIDPRSVLGRVYGPSAIEHHLPSSATATDLLVRLAPTGMYFDYTANCFGSARSGCAAVYLDDLPMSSEDLSKIPSAEVAVIAVVRSIDAAILLGQPRDAIMVYTRNGREPTKSAASTSRRPD